MSAREALRYRCHRPGRGPPSEWTASELAGPAGAGRPAARALPWRRATRPATSARLEFHGRTTCRPRAAAAATSAGARRARGGAASSSLRARGSRSWRGGARAFSSALVLGPRLASLSACNDEPAAKGDFVPPIDEMGRYHDVGRARRRLPLERLRRLRRRPRVCARIASPTWPSRSRGSTSTGDRPRRPVDMPAATATGITRPRPRRRASTPRSRCTRGGDPRIAYYDATDGALQFARRAACRFARPHRRRGPRRRRQVGLLHRPLARRPRRAAIAYHGHRPPRRQGGLQVRAARGHGQHDRPRRRRPTGSIDGGRLDAPSPAPAAVPRGTACIQTAMVNGHAERRPVDSRPASTARRLPQRLRLRRGQACIRQRARQVRGRPPRPRPARAASGLFTQARRTAGDALARLLRRSAGRPQARAPSGPDGSSPSRSSTAATPRPTRASSPRRSSPTRHAPRGLRGRDRRPPAVQGRWSGTAAGPRSRRRPSTTALRDDGRTRWAPAPRCCLSGTRPRVVYQDQAARGPLLAATRAGAGLTRRLDSGHAGFGWWPHLLDAHGGSLWLTQSSTIARRRPLASSAALRARSSYSRDALDDAVRPCIGAGSRRRRASTRRLASPRTLAREEAAVR